MSDQTVSWLDTLIRLHASAGAVHGLLARLRDQARYPPPFAAGDPEPERHFTEVLQDTARQLRAAAALIEALARQVVHHKTLIEDRDAALGQLLAAAGRHLPADGPDAEACRIAIERARAALGMTGETDE